MTVEFRPVNTELIDNFCNARSISVACSCVLYWCKSQRSISL